MKATDFQIRYDEKTSEKIDPLADYVNQHQDQLKDLDQHWNEVMEIAKKYGFINQAAGGVALLCTHRSVFEGFGAEEVAKNLRMNAVELPESWEVGK